MTTPYRIQRKPYVAPRLIPLAEWCPQTWRWGLHHALCRQHVTTLGELRDEARVRDAVRPPFWARLRIWLFGVPA